MPDASNENRLSLRERKHALVCNEIGHVAMQLFLERGFDATTVDDIVKAAGVGRRTFFRYFETKEAVVLSASEAFGKTVADAIAEQPADCEPLRALENAFVVVVDAYDREPGARAFHRLIEEHPMLRARNLDQQERWCPLFAAALGRRVRAKRNAMALELLARTSLAAFRTALSHWSADPKANLARTVASTFATLREGLGL